MADEDDKDQQEDIDNPRETGDDELELTDEQHAMLDDVAAVAEQAGIDDPRLFLWDIRPADILYLFNRFPFLQIVDTRVEVDPPAEPNFIVADSSGWTIYDYGNAMSTSPGLYLWGGETLASLKTVRVTAAMWSTQVRVPWLIRPMKP